MSWSGFEWGRSMHYDKKIRQSCDAKHSQEIGVSWATLLAACATNKLSLYSYGAILCTSMRFPKDSVMLKYSTPCEWEYHLQVAKQNSNIKTHDTETQMKPKFPERRKGATETQTQTLNQIIEGRMAEPPSPASDL
jgi:hypothetical protein